MKVIVSRAFKFAIDHRFVNGIDRSPTFGVTLGREEEKKPEILNIDEIRKLLNEAKRLESPWPPRVER